jgi:hypothetical protein
MEKNRILARIDENAEERKKELMEQNEMVNL